ncbi:MAG: biotin-dependent carboxyltransferase family protein [Sulfitobacter sp.]
MSTYLEVVTAGPTMALQDLGRPGFIARGLTRSGAMDPVALFEAAALLGEKEPRATIEMSGMGGTFTASQDMRFALTGGEMVASIDGAAIVWNACHLLPAGAVLAIGGAKGGAYGYLTPAGGIASDPVMGSRASHISAGIGAVLAAGDKLPLGRDPGGDTRLSLPPIARFGGGVLRVVPSMQTEKFDEATRARFEATEFRRDPRANRQGVRMDQDGEGFFADGQLNIVSEVIVSGDIQITGDGAPFVLMAESQTTGGYPRIGTVIPADLPIAAQAKAGDKIRFAFITMEEARAIEQRFRAEFKGLAAKVTPLVRDPYAMRDLLSYQLVGGVISADADPFAEE